MDWKNKKVLVTGADGFIGSHLVEMLHATGAKVKALTYYNSFNYWGWLEGLTILDDIEVINGDIRDPFICNSITRDTDIIFHLAALISIPYSYEAPKSYIETNVTGTLNMCHAALHNKCGRIICTSTSEVYGTANYVPIDEKHPLQPQSPYSASKIGGDSIAMSYFHSFGLPLVLARPFNTYGPRQSLRAVIPSIITQMLKGEKESHLGNVSPTRDFNYVKDTCKGLISLGEAEDIEGEIINIGSGSEISISDLFMLIKKLTNSLSEMVVREERIRPENSEVFRLCCDNSKLKNLSGYSPRYSLEQGLKETIQWYMQSENLDKFKTHIYNV
ncbi:MAG: SDR family NAD(P)-dependent oxidoreductase [Bacteroidales bacterium]|nr:SDR family NAD(P)-dependent oxidoreductase [Bacteroidales bacterium]